MRFITADYIFPVSSAPIKNGVVAVHEDGTIEEVLSPLLWRAAGGEVSNLETYSGIICPGFINSHCHLELSHLKGRFAEGKGLPHFIGNVIAERQEQEEIIAESISRAEDEMIRNGIVAIGDICNTADTIPQKEKSRLHYHNFIELFDLHPGRAQAEFEKGKQLFNDFRKLNHSSSFAPHAPYSVSRKLFKLITEFNFKVGGLLSIHNQETESENEMFLRGSGDLFKKLSSFGNLYNDWKPTNTSSLSYILSNITNLKTLLVHNTYIMQENIDSTLSSIIHHPSSFFFFCFCFCPNANLYIENRLPDFNLFNDNTSLKNKIVVGTDSYASNHQLSILSELKTISKHFPSITLNDLIAWATLNGAEFFRWDKELGSIEKGKNPGLNLITNIDEQSLSLTEHSEVKPLLN